MAVKFQQLHGDFIGGSEFQYGFGPKLMGVVVIESAGDQFNRDTVFLHGTQSHYANACFQGQ